MNVFRLHPTLAHHIVNTLGWRDLRPLQADAIDPVLRGADTLLLAPTAGGKTEAAGFPILTRMESEAWRGTSVLYVCPLKALLNNLLPRLQRYCGWLGRTAELWHGDVPASVRRRILDDRPDMLLTTPESLDAMLVSAKVDHREFFADLNAVVVDEVHAFAGDDRGWHLLAVLERLSRVAGRQLQRVGLSATVGNPHELIGWLQGCQAATREPVVVAPDVSTPAQLADASTPAGAPGAPVADVDVELDYVGSVANAAKVIASLHLGEKRLVFCESRRLVEELGASLRANGVTTFLSHASLAADERRQAERAFQEARDCVIVATSTLELGVDVGDLDRVIQIGAPTTVASFLQRVGRTGRRPGTNRNCLFLALDDESLLRAAGLLVLWGKRWVEPLIPPSEPRHIISQQLLALCLQEGRVGPHTWEEWIGPVLGDDTEAIARHLVSRGYLAEDDGMLFIGPEAEAAYGRRHFMELTAVFTTRPEFTVMHGRSEIGRTDPGLLIERVEGPRLLLLAGRTWKVNHRDWSRRVCYVEPFKEGGRGKARWLSAGGMGGLSHRMTRAMRAVVLGDEPPVALTGRARHRLAEVRDGNAEVVDRDGTVMVRRPDGSVSWWTWAGFKANATLAASLRPILDDGRARFTDREIGLRGDVSCEEWADAVADALRDLKAPEVDQEALKGLKFSEALPASTAIATMSARLADPEPAKAILSHPVTMCYAQT